MRHCALAARRTSRSCNFEFYWIYSNLTGSYPGLYYTIKGESLIKHTSSVVRARLQPYLQCGGIGMRRPASYRSLQFEDFGNKLSSICRRPISFPPIAKVTIGSRQAVHAVARRLLIYLKSPVCVGEPVRVHSLSMSTSCII
jgi:hypothetical protein